jgi:hypothetical protein
LALFQPFVERGLLVVLASSLRSSWDLVHGRLGRTWRRSMRC